MIETADRQVKQHPELLVSPLYSLRESFLTKILNLTQAKLENMKLELKHVSQTHKWNSSDLFIAPPTLPLFCNPVETFRNPVNYESPWLARV